MTSIEGGLSLPAGVTGEQLVAPSNSVELTQREREIFSKTNIFLIGLPGSGKSTVGPEIARLTGMTFKDSDALFKEWTNKDPNRYIEDYGMPAFREKESSVLDLAVVNTDQVIATGGGIVETPKNVGLILKHGLGVYLEADIDTIVNRIMNDPNNDRAGLVGQPFDVVYKIVRERYIRRYSAFQAVPIHIKVDKIGPKQVAHIARTQALRRLGVHPSMEVAS